MQSGDNHIVINLIMIELLGTIFFLAIVTICIYIKRFFVRKSLTGNKVLITNGETSLSQELAESLSSKHNCHVILVKQRNANGITTKPNVNFIELPGISVHHCDILNNEDLESFSQTVQETFNGIDIVIDNATKGVFIPPQQDDCRHFVDATASKLRSTINMLMHFIPKLKYSKCGHFITIQPITSNKKPLLSSYREIKELINLLTDNQSSYSFDLFNKQKIRLTTVLWNCDDVAECNGYENNNQPDIKQISERIVDGIRANRAVVHCNNSIHPINTIRNFFQKKTPPSCNSNGHNKVK